MAEGSPVENDEKTHESFLGTRFWLIVGLLVFFARIGLEHMTYKIYKLFLEKATVLWKKNEENEEKGEPSVQTTDRTCTLPQHSEEVLEQVLALSTGPGIDHPPGIDPGSSPATPTASLKTWTPEGASS